jgi:transaldolase
MNQSELRSRIRREAETRRGRTAADIIETAKTGDTVAATGDLLFHTPPDQFSGKLDGVLNAIGEISEAVAVDYLVKLAIDLSSFLPEWNLKPGLSQTTIAEATARVLDALRSTETKYSATAAAMRARLTKEHLTRITVEGVEDASLAEAEAAELVGNSLADYVENMSTLISRSNLYQVSLSRLKGETLTEIGNDYAVFLQHVIWMGATFCTTNPVLIKLAWDTDPEYWNNRADQIIDRAIPDAGTLLSAGTEQLKDAVFEINSKLTMAVVLENCKLLRDIFLVTEGQQGYVSLQVNPEVHEDADLMVSEARRLYEELDEALAGVPNVVFKLPSTAPGLEAAAALTSAGIGVTITLTFSVFQSMGFAEVLQRGDQLVSYIAIMNGRMAYPVRDEIGVLDVDGGIEAARWAGVAVARKANRALYSEGSGLNVDAKRVRIMIASLRIYDDGRDGGWIPDVSELWGIPLITVFPNVRRAFDLVSREARPHAVDDPLPDGVVETLNHSGIFRQAWWVPGDPDAEKPAPPITLSKDDGILLTQWQPVDDTLTQFIDFYRQMGELVVGRLRVKAKETEGL